MAKENISKSKDIISNWGDILLDTTVVIRALSYKKNQAEVNKFCYDLLKFLSDNQYQKTKTSQSDRRFNVSAITIAEILEKVDNSTNKSQKIIQLLNAKNLMILDFDEDVANIFNSSFCEKLGQKNQGQILKRWGEENSKNNRQALNNDLMILASGICVNVDTVLCVDKGMYKIGKDCGLNMIYVDEKYFNYNEKYFFDYKRTESDKDLLIP